MKNRFRLVRGEDAKRHNLPGAGHWLDDYEYCLYDYKTDPPVLLFSDEMAPEDANFLRDLAWVPKLLNQLEEEKGEEDQV